MAANVCGAAAATIIKAINMADTRLNFKMFPPWCHFSALFNMAFFAWFTLGMLYLFDQFATWIFWYEMEMNFGIHIECSSDGVKRFTYDQACS